MNVLTVPGAIEAMPLEVLERVVACQMTKRAVRARIADRSLSSGTPWTKDDALSVLGLRCWSSDDRAAIASLLISNIEPDGFWPVLIQGWTTGDAIDASTQREIRRQISRTSRPSWWDYASFDDRDFYDGLPDEVIMYRGADRSRVSGMAWTTDSAVAEGFARGHRGMRHREPVVAVGRIRKELILFCATERGESEIVANPGDVRIISVGQLLAAA